MAPEGKIALMVMRLDANSVHKGLDRVMQALGSEELATLNLVVVGDGDLRSKYENAVRSLDLGSRVVFVGRVDEERLREYYWLADVFVQPSVPQGDSSGSQRYVEGFGITFLEATAAGLPCVGSLHGGAAEAIEDGVCGVRINGTTDEIVSAITAMLTLGPLPESPAVDRWLSGFSGERGLADIRALLDIAEVRRTSSQHALD